MSSGTLSPAFAAGTTSYDASVTNATSSITVTRPRSSTSSRMRRRRSSISKSGSPAAGVLREGDEPDEHGPQPSLRSLGALVEQMRAALETMKNMQALDQQVTIRSAMNAKNREEIEELAKKLVM